MTKTEIKKYLGVWGNATSKDTCDKLQAEIIRKIMNCKAITDFEKMTMLRQYMDNAVTNNFILESIKQFNQR